MAQFWARWRTRIDLVLLVDGAVETKKNSDIPTEQEVAVDKPIR